MAKGTAKLRLLIDLKQKLKGGLDIAKDKVEKATGHMQKRLDDFKLKNVEAFKAIRKEVPGVERVLNMLQNPYILATAAVVAFLALSGKASKEAMSFEHSFMNIRQLNLDKSRHELDLYRSDIADTAFMTGVNLVKMTNAYYDLQSGLSIYGKDVSTIAQKIGKYSISTQADYNDSINQTIKAMKAFGINASGVDGLLESNAKTVQVGIVTYAELARVQTEYAGSAAAANQQIDTANKLFAAFTSIAKNADIAANMTKMAFTGLADPKVLKAMQKYGVTIYDNASNMRQLDKIIQDTSMQINKMNDQTFNNFMGDVGGPEGLRLLFGKLRTGAEDFFNTMRAYDNSPVNLDKMYQNALQDATTMANMVKENFKVIFTEFGMVFLPIILKVSTSIRDFLGWLRETKDELAVVKGAIVGIGIAWTVLNAQMIVGKVAAIGMLTVTKMLTAAQWLYNVALNANPIGLIVIAIGALIGGLVMAYKKFDKFRAIVLGTWEVIKMFGTALKDYVVDRVKGIISGLGSMATAIVKLFQKDFKGAKESAKLGIKELSGYEAKQRAFQSTRKVKTVFQNKYQTVMDDAAKQKSAEGDPSTESPTNPVDDPLNPSPSVTDINSIAQGSQSKNITITIDSFIKNYTPEHESVNKMSTYEIERWLSEMFMRVIKSAEQTI